VGGCVGVCVGVGVCVCVCVGVCVCIVLVRGMMIIKTYINIATKGHSNN
jgi:hypothetical protein